MEVAASQPRPERLFRQMFSTIVSLTGDKETFNKQHSRCQHLLLRQSFFLRLGVRFGSLLIFLWGPDIFIGNSSPTDGALPLALGVAGLGLLFHRFTPILAVICKDT